MSQYYAEIQGHRGSATREGTIKSGIWGHIRGWSIGARVEIGQVNGKDEVRIWKTSGSNGGKSDKLIAKYKG